MTLEQLTQKIKNQIQQSSTITHGTLIQLKKFLDDLKNNQNSNIGRNQQTLLLKQKIIGHINHAFYKEMTHENEKIIMLEILQKDLISTKHNAPLFNKLYNFLLEQNENVAIQASRAIDFLIKQISQAQQATPNAINLDIKNHYIKLFQFLRNKTRFLLNLKQHTKDIEFKIYKRYPDQNQIEKQKQKKQICFKNSKSLKFINQVPHLFIHLMAYVDTSNRNIDDDHIIRQLIHQSITNIINSLKDTPYQEFYNEFNYQFNNQLFGMMTKLLQFLFINLKNDKDQSSSGYKSNINLRYHISQQIDQINVPLVIKNFIYLLKNCSQDFQLNRLQITNRLKCLLGNLDRNRLYKKDVLQIIIEILNQDVIYGRKKILGDYSKNAICSYWIEIIRSPVLITHIFPINILANRPISQNTLTQDDPQIINCFMYIEKMFEQVLKTIFDNSIYPSVQQKCLDLIIFFIEQLFPQGTDQHDTNIIHLNNSLIARKIHDNKLRITLKILNTISYKFRSIRQTFQQIDLYVTKKLGHSITKKDLPEPLKLDHLQLNSIKISSFNSQNWNNQVINLIQNYDQEIDKSLLTLTAMQNRFLTIYQQQDQLCFNSHPVKMNNYTLYMKQVKTKLLEKCINLAHRITKVFLTQNIEIYTPHEINNLKAIYFNISNKKSLNTQQCNIISNILKNGLKIFQILHNYDLHSDDQSNKKGHLKNFMLIFAQIYDPVNFRDIFQPNMDQFFRNLIMYAKNCADFCLQFVLIQPFCSNTNNTNQLFNKNIVELLTYNLILRLQSTSDQLDPFHEFYHYKQQYFLLLQKLIRFPFRCLSRYSDDSFIRNYFRQIILFLTKKAHTSAFSLDYLHLMRTLFKNILFNTSRDAASPLFSQFHAICSKNSLNTPNPTNPHSVFVNINILQNFLKIFDTGIPQLADIITQLVIMLPLKSKHIIQFAKHGYIIKPLLHCLCLMSDYNYLLRTLKTFEIIISHSTSQQICQLLQGQKQKLINRLFEMVNNQYKSYQLKPQKINNDLSSLSLKLLAKLGALSRNRNIFLKMKSKQENQQNQLLEFNLIYQDLLINKKIKTSMSSCIQYALEIFYKLLDSYYQTVVFISMEMIQKCFNILNLILPITLEKMHPLSQKIICVFSSILSLSSKYLTISQSILNRIRQQVNIRITGHAEQIKNQLKSCGLTQYCKFFIKCLVTNLNQRVLITREDNFIKQISQQPKKFLWGLIKSIINVVQDKQTQQQVYRFIITLLISQIIMINNPNHIQLNKYQKQYNHILPYKNAALISLNEIIDQTPIIILQQLYINILQSIFITIITIPDIMNLKIIQYPRIIAKKIYNFMLKDQNKFLINFYTEKGQKIFITILQNLISFSNQAHYISKMFLLMIMNQTNLNLNQLMYGGCKWIDICDNSCQQTYYQSKYSLNQFSTNKEIKKFPILTLIKNMLRVAHNVNQQNCKENQKNLKMLSNTFITFQLLITIKSKGKLYQMFTILTKQKQNLEFIDQNIQFHQTFKKIIVIAQQVININCNLYQNYTKIIIGQDQNTTNITNITNTNTNTTNNNNNNPNISNLNVQPNNTTSNTTNIPTTTQQPSINRNIIKQTTLPRSRQINLQSATNQTTSNQSFNINKNTFIDDQQYGLNIQDLDIEIKIWGNLISSTLYFLKSILINQNVFQVSKNMLRQKKDKSKLIITRLEIIFIMFDLVGRIDRNVRQTSYKCLKELLSKQQHPKQLIQNDDKLKHILRPVLISLQQDFKKFTPSFLNMFKKILKLLTQCFNITLINKLVQKLKQMEKDKEKQISNSYNNTNNNNKYINTNIIQQQQQQQQQQQNNNNSNLTTNIPKTMNYSQIITEVKCIASFLDLFQHLTYAFYNHRSQNYIVTTMILIFKYVLNIINYFIPRLGKHTITIYIKKTLVKVLNTMSQKLSGQNIFIEAHERQLNLQNFLDLLKLQQSYPLRQKLTRQTSYIQKALIEFSNSKNKKDYYIFLQVIYIFAKTNNKWMKNYQLLNIKIIKDIQQIIQHQLEIYQKKYKTQYQQKIELLLLIKILLYYYKANLSHIKSLFTLVIIFKLRCTFDLHFLRRYLKDQLYYSITIQIRKNILLEYFWLLQSTNNILHTDKILSISQNIIYNFILIQMNLPELERTILNDNEIIMINLTKTIKICLDQKNLQNKTSNISRNDPNSYNHYRLAIQVLQISNLCLAAYKNYLPSLNKNQMLIAVWSLLKTQDRVIRHYAFVWISNYIRIFDGIQSKKILNIYYMLIKTLENLNQCDYQIGALIKKALNILIPYWNSNSKEDNNWINYSLKGVHQDTNQTNKLVRLWQIVVKNHNIFHKHKARFETQMVNSMQWLMVANNPTSSNPLVKKIASDMSFIYIEWKFKQAQVRLSKCQPQAKINALKESGNDKAAEIFLNFFIKVAINNCIDKQDKQIMKRSLYLLKKCLILWPNTPKKFQGIKVMVNKLKNISSSTQNTQLHLRFHYTLLNIINILLMYECDKNLLPQLMLIFRLLELGSHINPSRYSTTAAHIQQGTTIFIMNNVYLLNLLCCIIRRLVSAALLYPKDGQSQQLMQEINQYIRDGLQFYVISGTRTKTQIPPQMNRINSTGSNYNQQSTSNTKKIQIEVTICFLKILFDIDPNSIDMHLNYIKQATTTYKKSFEKIFDSTSKNNTPSRVYQLPLITQGSFSQIINKDLEINIELIKNQKISFCEQNYQKETIKTYQTKRPLFVILLRILASKFNEMPHIEDQINILDILISIFEKIPDPQLKLEIINIFKCMLIGQISFNNNKIPNCYCNIIKINYPLCKIFYLLFEDNSKFNQHFQRRKSKPSDQNYNIYQRIYQQITTKYYFNFLCQFIISLQQIPFEFLEKIKIFILYASKVADSYLVDQIFSIIQNQYQRNSTDIFVNLFEDYKELNCAQQYLQGDQIMLYFTTFLYKKSIRNLSLTIEIFQKQVDIQYHQYFINFLKADQNSSYHLKLIYNALKLSINLLPYSRFFTKILKEYLMDGSYNDIWGSILLQLAIELKCVNSKQLCCINTKIGQWGLLLQQLQKDNSQNSKLVLDYVYRIYGDNDLIYGYRIRMSNNFEIQQAYCKLQQRKYLETLKIVQNIQNNKLKRQNIFSQQQQHNNNNNNNNLQIELNNTYIKDICKQCYKNLNRWDKIIDQKIENNDMISKIQYLFHCHGNQIQISQIIHQLDKIDAKQFPFYYGKSILNFLEVNNNNNNSNNNNSNNNTSNNPKQILTREINKQLNVALLYALLEWQSFPKNAKQHQNSMLSCIECLLELEQGQKIKDDSLTTNMVDALAKVVQSLYVQINFWRQRMPQKNENLSTWYMILEERIFIYQFMKKRVIYLLDNLNKITTNTQTEKLLIPYTDIQWNKLKIIRQQRNFKFYNQNNILEKTQNLYQDEVFLKEKEKFYQEYNYKKNQPKSIQILDNIIKDLNRIDKDQELEKFQKMEALRLKAEVYCSKKWYDSANQIYNQAVKGSQQQHLLSLWRDWMVMCMKAYQETQIIQWAQSSISILPYALRYKTYKTRLLLAPIFKFLKDLHKCESINQTLHKVYGFIQIKSLLIWLPQMIKISQSKTLISNCIHNLLSKLTICYPQILYFTFKPFFKSSEMKSIRDSYINMKKVFYNLVTKLENFIQLIVEIKNKDKINIITIGALSRCFAEIQIPLYQDYKGQIESILIPKIAQISENIENEEINNKIGKILTLLGTDGKQYRFRLQKTQRSTESKDQTINQDYENIFCSQMLEIINNYLIYWRQSSVRKLKCLESRQLYLYQITMSKSSKYTITLLDILNQYMTNQTTFQPQYPQSDKSLFKLPRNEINKTVNKRMKQIISQKVLNNYFLNKSYNYQQFFTFRKQFAYQYGTILAINYSFNINLQLSNYLIDMKSGLIYLLNIKLNSSLNQVSPFAVRLSRNIITFITKTQMNAYIIPSFTACIQALQNPKFNLKCFIDLLYQQVFKLDGQACIPIMTRIEEIVRNPTKVRKILEVGQNINNLNNIPYQLKYWF